MNLSQNARPRYSQYHAKTASWICPSWNSTTSLSPQEKHQTRRIGGSSHLLLFFLLRTRQCTHLHRSLPRRCWVTRRLVMEEVSFWEFRYPVLFGIFTRDFTKVPFFGTSMMERVFFFAAHVMLCFSFFWWACQKLVLFVQGVDSVRNSFGDLGWVLNL